MTQDKQDRFPPLQELINEALEDKDSKNRAQKKRVAAFQSRLELSLGNAYDALAKEAELKTTWDKILQEPIATFQWCGNSFIIQQIENCLSHPWDITYQKIDYPVTRSFREGKDQIRAELLQWLGEIEKQLQEEITSKTTR